LTAKGFHYHGGLLFLWANKEKFAVESHKMIRISAVIITYNEERNIARCIDSVRPVADEIVVLDCFSQDRTREICEAKGAKFYSQEFLGFAKQKNRAVALASSDYVLSLDADEYISSELTQSILQVKANWTHDGYLMNRLSSFDGTWIKTCGWYPDQKLRLWDRRKGSWQGDGVHERVDIIQGATSKPINGDLFHRAYDNISQFLQKNQNYSTIHAQVNRYKTSSSVFKIIYKTVFAFFKAYILKGGILDGYKGLVVSGSTAHWVFYKYAKLLEANRSVKVSLIIESSGVIDDLEKTLTSITHQKELPDEVIVNGKTADAMSQVRGLSQNFPVPLSFVGSANSNGLTAAIDQAKEEYVVVLKEQANIPQSLLKVHRAKAWKGRVVSGVSGSQVRQLTRTNAWNNILGNGTVAFWKEDYDAENAASGQGKAVASTDSESCVTNGISVVIPNFNGTRLFPHTLPPLFKALEKSGLASEVIIVDDCSTDESVEFLKANFPNVKVIVSDVNRGFSPTINKGMRAAYYDLVFLLNSDVKLEPDYFIHLIPYFEKSDTFGVMGQIVNWDDDRIQDGAKLPTFQGAKIKTFKNFLPSETPIEGGLYTMYLSGAETLVSKQKLMMLGGFDEIFAPYYIEDYELSLRAWRLGWKCYYDHRSVCRHKTSSTIKSKSRKRHIQTIYYRNKMFLHAIHLNRFQMWMYVPQLIFECLVRVVSFRFHYVESIILFIRDRKKCKESRKRFEKLSNEVGTKIPLGHVAATIIRSLNRTIIWRF
jgi:GT2 family glycosyltransferase